MALQTAEQWKQSNDKNSDPGVMENRQKEPRHGPSLMPSEHMYSMWRQSLTKTRKRIKVKEQMWESVKAK